MYIALGRNGERALPDSTGYDSLYGPAMLKHARENGKYLLV